MIFLHSDMRIMNRECAEVLIKWKSQMQRQLKVFWYSKEPISKSMHIRLIIIYLVSKEIKVGCLEDDGTNNGKQIDEYLSHYCLLLRAGANECHISNWNASRQFPSEALLQRNNGNNQQVNEYKLYHHLFVIQVKCRFQLPLGLGLKSLNRFLTVKKKI